MVLLEWGVPKCPSSKPFKDSTYTLSSKLKLPTSPSILQLPSSPPIKGKTEHKQHDGLNGNGKNKEKKKTTEGSLVIARAKKKKESITAVKHWLEKTGVMPWLVVQLEFC